MPQYLSSDHFPTESREEKESLDSELDALLRKDLQGSFYQLFASYQRILADNAQRKLWPGINTRLSTLFKCGKSTPLDGPMIGIPVSIRDTDYFKETVSHFGKDRSRIASIEWMATAWNMTFADTGLWMGKTFEPIDKAVMAEKCGDDPKFMTGYDPDTSRIGRNYFRDPADPNLIQSLGLPALTPLWKLLKRPLSTTAEGFDGKLTAENLAKENTIPYNQTGGIFLANNGHSVVPEMCGKEVYQLNYRWPALNPVYPMTRLVDELVQVAEGIYLGQLVYASKNYSLGTLRLPFCPDLPEIPVGMPYDPDQKHPLDFLWKRFTDQGEGVDYGYQNNGYFLMMDPSHAKQVYADDAFPQLRPRPGEQGFIECGYDKEQAESAPHSATDTGQKSLDYWVNGWKNNKEHNEKFTTFILEPSPKESDTDDILNMRRDDESILQMLQRISLDISAQTKADDRLIHFAKLHRLFRGGIAPTIENGVFKGHGKKGYNVQGDEKEGFDYYHGANLNLHLGAKETFCPDPNAAFDSSELFPGAFASKLGQEISSPNILDMTWHSIGKYIFPWAGKSFTKISGRKLSMLLDESSDLAKRYPERVNELQTHLASAPHYDLVEKAAANHWLHPGKYADHLSSGCWDRGMSEEDKIFWKKEAQEHWIDGCNLQDKRIVPADLFFRMLDMNYRTPDPAVQLISERGPSPFARQGYIFLGTSDRDSILAINNGSEKKKKVFQFHYRYPMIGGPAPIGFCLDELVEIADGLFLGQLIYSTALHEPFHSAVDPSRYDYQLFGYFLLLDDEWQEHRKAIKLDTVE